jgi:hypothetical protein
MRLLAEIVIIGALISFGWNKPWPGKWRTHSCGFRDRCARAVAQRQFSRRPQCTTVGTGYDRVNLGGGGAANATIAGSNLVVHVGFAVNTATVFTSCTMGVVTEDSSSRKEAPWWPTTVHCGAGPFRKPQRL